MRKLRKVILFVVVVVVVVAVWPFVYVGAHGAAVLAASADQIREAAPAPPPDARFKADILVIVAHPDDETMVTGYLARAIFDGQKRVAAIFGTPGNGGGDVAKCDGRNRLRADEGLRSDRDQ